MRRLRIDQPVSVNLDGVAEPISCRVLDVQGAMGRLAYRDELPPRVVGRLAVGSPGYLVFEAFGMPVGLRVAVRASPPHLDVAVMDGIALPERRIAERVKLVTRVRIAPGDGFAEGERDLWTETVNLSYRGALIRRHPVLDGQKRFGLQLMFGGDPQPITAHAAIARRMSDAVGVVFESITADDVTRLNEYLAGIRLNRRSGART